MIARNEFLQIRERAVRELDMLVCVNCSVTRQNTCFTHLHENTGADRLASAPEGTHSILCVTALRYRISNSPYFSTPFPSFIYFFFYSESTKIFLMVTIFQYLARHFL